MVIGIMRLFGLAVLGLATQARPAHAQGYYQGKTVEIIASSGVGDTYDTLSRLVGRHIGRHLPGNPSVVVKTMPGAGGILAANYLYNVAAKDGTSFGMLDQSIFETQLFTPGSLKADVRTRLLHGRSTTT